MCVSREKAYLGFSCKRNPDPPTELVTNASLPRSIRLRPNPPPPPNIRHPPNHLPLRNIPHPHLHLVPARVPAQGADNVCPADAGDGDSWWRRGGDGWKGDGWGGGGVGEEVGGESDDWAERRWRTIDVESVFSPTSMTNEA